MFEQLKGSPRLLIHADLKPVQGDRFQPTGFADLGAAIYERPDGRRMLLVESAQSMANRLEHTCLAGDGPDIATELQGLPYVVARLRGKIATGRGVENNYEAKTSSLVEAHRLNSPYIIANDSFRTRFVERAGYSSGQPIDWARIAAAIFFFDPNALLHGVFMANLEDGRIKIPRLLSGFIEAEDAREVLSGGVKNNPLDPTGTIRSVNLDENVYGNVPYHRTEFTARRIVAYFNLDLALLEAYGLKPPATALLTALALYKVRRLLFGGLRLRTACDLGLEGEAIIDRPNGFVLPSAENLLEAIQKSIAECAGEELFAKPPTTELTTEVKRTKKQGSKAAEEETEDNTADNGD
jgi:CRISPR-associated protein Csb1